MRWTLPLLALFSLATAHAEPLAPRVRILVLPLQIHWGEKELSPRTFFDVLEEEAERKAPRANLVIPSPEDPRLQGVDLSRRPTPAEALALARTFHAPLVVSLDIQFQRKVEERSQGPLLNVGALALVTIVEESSGKVVMQEPVAVSHCNHSPGADTPEFEKQAMILSMETAHDLADLIIVAAQKHKKELEGGGGL